MSSAGDSSETKPLSLAFDWCNLALLETEHLRLQHWTVVYKTGRDWTMFVLLSQTCSVHFNNVDIMFILANKNLSLKCLNFAVHNTLIFLCTFCPCWRISYGDKIPQFSPSSKNMERKANPPVRYFWPLNLTLLLEMDPILLTVGEWNTGDRMVCTIV